MEQQFLRGHLPVLVLALLDERPMHGYGLAREIKKRGGDMLKLGEGTLYPLLYRLESEGAIAARWETGPRGKPRKVYHITRSGRRRLNAGRADWVQLQRAFKALLGEGWSRE